MADQQPLPPVEGIAFLKDMGRNDMARRDGRSVAKRQATTDHVDGRYMVGGREQNRPVLVQRNADDLGFNSPAELLIVDGTAATQLKVAETGQVSVPLPTALPIDAVMTGNVPLPAGDAVPERTQATQPEAPKAIQPIPVQLDRSEAATRVLDVAAVKAPAAKKMVVIQGQGIGKLRVFCTQVVISDKLVVLAYPMDGSTAIVEPPTTNGSENLLTLVVDGKEYICVSYGLSFEFNDLLMVILVKAS